MPRAIFNHDYPYLPHSALLSFEEITRIARIFVVHGVEKIRLTGGEPLLRKDIEGLVEMLNSLRTRKGGALDLTLTTNGSLLAKKAQVLKDAGLSRVTVSLDSLDDATFKRMNDADFPVAEVLHGIDVAHRVGLGPIKINMVVKKGTNDHEIIPMARHFKNTPYVLRFIEYMDVGNSNGWKMSEVVPSSEIRRRVAEAMPLAAINRLYAGETAERWRYIDGTGEIGLISSVTNAFCATCSRARLSTEGKIYTCLFASKGHDLRALLRTGHSDAEIFGAVERLWQIRSDRYSEQRAERTHIIAPPVARLEMSYIGG